MAVGSLQSRNFGHSMTNPPEHVSDNGFLTILGRVLAAASAVACCWLLYRIAQGFLNRQQYVRSRRRSDRRFFAGRTDAQYSRLGADEDSYDDQLAEEDEGYHDDSVLARSMPKVNVDRPLPDKPLPPLPTADGT